MLSGASIMESETTTHLIALTVVDSYLKHAASCAEGKGSVCSTLGASVSASYSNAIHIRMDISRSMGTRTRKHNSVHEPMLYGQGRYLSLLGNLWVSICVQIGHNTYSARLSECRLADPPPA